MSSVIAFVVVLVIYSHAYLYLWDEQIVNVMPGIWYLAIFSLGILGGILSFGRRAHTAQFDPRANWVNQRPIIVWAALFLACAWFSYLFSERLPLQLRALKTLVICIGMLGSFLLTLRGEKQIRAARLAMLCVVLLSVVLNFVDFTGIYNFSQASGRAAGFYVNPNIAGFYLASGMVLTASLVPRRWRLHYCLLVGAGVTVTFSRSSVLMWLIGLYGLSQMRLFNFTRRTLSILWVGLVSIILVVQFGEDVLDGLGLTENLSEDARSRIEFNYQTDESVRGRLAVAERSMDLIVQAPWSGHGLGAASIPRTQVSPHNMFLLLGVEMGALGLVLYACLSIILWRMNSPIARLFASVLFIGSLFSHNLLDQTALWLALALVASAAAVDQGPTPPHKTGRLF